MKTSIVLSMLTFAALALNTSRDASAADPLALSSRNTAVQTYACDLRPTANQCRQFFMVVNRGERLKTLSDGCASMGGTFRAQASCPSQARSARCVDVTPDPNHLDRLDYTYDAHYYAVGLSGWTRQSVQRVCTNLMGVYVPD